MHYTFLLQVAPPPVVINTEEVAESAVNDIEVLSLAEAAAKIGVVTSLISTPTTTSAQTGGDISDTAASSTSEEDEETAAANTVRFLRPSCKLHHCCNVVVGCLGGYWSPRTSHGSAPRKSRAFVAGDC